MNIIKICFFGLLFVSCNQSEKAIDVFSEKEVNIGTVSLSDTVHFDVEITNPMDEDLVIKNAASSCGCSLVSIKDSVVKPNQTTKLEIEFIPKLSGSLGSTEKAIVIETNSKKRFHELLIKANIE